MKLHILLSMITILLVSCTDGEQSLKEQTLIQTKEQITAQNLNQEAWSDKLAKDLGKKRRFITAVEGEFEGEFNVSDTTYKIKVLITPTIPDYNYDRVRTLAELEYELQNLKLNIQVIQWNPNNQFSAVGCILEKIEADIQKGIVDLVSSNCSKNTYKLFIADDSTDTNTPTESRTLATELQNGQRDYIETFKGKLRSGANAKTYEFTLRRI